MNQSEPVALTTVRSTIPSFDGVKVSIRPDADPKEVISSLHRCFSGLETVRKIQKAMLYIVGAHLRVVADRELYRPKYKSLEKFIQAEICDRYGTSRQSVFNHYSVMKNLPQINPSDASKINQTNLMGAAKLLRDGLAEESEADTLIEDAKNLTSEEFREKHPEIIHSGTGRKVIRIPTTAKNVKLFWSMVGDQDPWEFLVSLLERSKDATIAASRPPKKQRSGAAA